MKNSRSVLNTGVLTRLHSIVGAPLGEKRAGARHRRRAGFLQTAPAALSSSSSRPCWSSLTTPPSPPSLQPPAYTPSIQIAGTEVRSIRSHISARMAGPSAAWSSSYATYVAPLASSSCFALMQKGHFVNESMTTGFAMSSSSLAFVAWTS